VLRTIKILVINRGNIMPKQERVKTKYPGIYNEAKHNLRTYNFVGISGICPTWQLTIIHHQLLDGRVFVLLGLILFVPGPAIRLRMP
jgi:hypothetical protein